MHPLLRRFGLFAVFALSIRRTEVPTISPNRVSGLNPARRLQITGLAPSKPCQPIATPLTFKLKLANIVRACRQSRGPHPAWSAPGESHDGSLLCAHHRLGLEIPRVPTWDVRICAVVQLRDTSALFVGKKQSPEETP